VVSREIRPTHPAVVTIGALNAGTTYNIIPERAHLKGTVRTLHDGGARHGGGRAAALGRGAGGVDARDVHARLPAQGAAAGQ
jgi:metal-dependent amidase/aminoacylase/carboxypeptidase family protein